MRTKSVLVILMISILGLAGSWPYLQASAQESNVNLFTNPGFEGGYYNQDNIPQIAVPNGWRMHWLDNVAFEGSEGVPAYRPETVVWYIEDAPERERPLFFRDGAYTLKIFKGYAPMYAAVSQDVSGLEVGRTYRISAPIFIDIVADYQNGSKVEPWRTDSGFVQFGVAPVGTQWLDFGNINYSGYWTAETIFPYYLSQPVFVWDFVASASDMTIWIEMGSRHPYSNNGFFMDGVGLFALDSTGNVVPPSNGGGGGGVAAGPVAPLPTVEPPEPNPDGSITHTVTSTDTLWTLAIQYAPLMGLAPEQAFPTLQELNNNPAFISPGQELIIIPAGSAPVVEEPAVEEEAGEPEEAAAGGGGGSGAAEGTGEDASTEEAAEEVAEEAVAEETAVEAAPAEEVAAAPANAVCVTVYQDANGDGIRDAANEALQANAAVTLFQGGDAISTQISDGINESNCFENLEANTYQVQVSPPANYAVTSDASWAIALAGGNTIPVSFGLQEAMVEDEVMEEETAVDAAPEDNADTAEAPEAQDDGSTGGFFSSVGGIVLVIALILLLLAGAGVAMLRRG